MRRGGSIYVPSTPPKLPTLPAQAPPSPGLDCAASETILAAPAGRHHIGGPTRAVIASINVSQITSPSDSPPSPSHAVADAPSLGRSQQQQQQSTLDAHTLLLSPTQAKLQPLRHKLSPSTPCNPKHEPCIEWLSVSSNGQRHDLSL